MGGHKIVRAILDNCVNAKCRQEDSIEFAIEMDWRGMFNENENNQTSLLCLLLDMKSEILSHPVVATFITLKWKKSQKYFYIQSGIFIAFLLLYSIFIVSVFCSDSETNSHTTFLDT